MSSVLKKWVSKPTTHDTPNDTAISFHQNFHPNLGTSNDLEDLTIMAAMSYKYTLSSSTIPI